MTKNQEQVLREQKASARDQTRPGPKARRILYPASPLSNPHAFSSTGRPFEVPSHQVALFENGVRQSGCKPFVSSRLPSPFASPPVAPCGRHGLRHALYERSPQQVPWRPPRYRPHARRSSLVLSSPGATSSLSRVQGII